MPHFDFPDIEMLMPSSHAVPDQSGSAFPHPMAFAELDVVSSFDDRIDAAAKLIWKFCQPLLDFLSAGSKPPAGDVISILHDCLAEAEQIAPGSVGTWHIASGRITTAQSRKSIYKKGLWLQSDTGSILDLNRSDLEAGYRFTQVDDSPIAEYRCEPGKSRVKTSPLLPIWRGECASPAGFASGSDMRNLFSALKLDVARTLAGA